MKKNGFVFLETIVVISVLSLTLMLLFGTYYHILRKTQERNKFDTTEMIYKTYYTNEILIKEYGSLSTYMNSCNKLKNDIYECNLTNNRLTQLKTIFEIDKIYFLNPYNVKNNSSSLLLLDATTVDYVKHIGASNKTMRMIIKYKKEYDDGAYEIYHSSMEVNS